jgi:NAD+ synthase (glutamine-hydrolysing)
MRYGYSPAKILFLAKKVFCNPEDGSGISRYSEETIEKWLRTFIRRFFSQQFKRSCMPDGPAVGSISLSPRGGWCMPSDAYDTIFSQSFDSKK